MEWLAISAIVLAILMCVCLVCTAYYCYSNLEDFTLFFSMMGCYFGLVACVFIIIEVVKVSFMV